MLRILFLFISLLSYNNTLQNTTYEVIKYTHAHTYTDKNEQVSIPIHEISIKTFLHILYFIKKCILTPSLCCACKNMYSCNENNITRLKFLLSSFTSTKMLHTCIRTYIHSYIHNRPLQPFSQDYGLPSHTIHVIYNFIRK